MSRLRSDFRSRTRAAAAISAAALASFPAAHATQPAREAFDNTVISRRDPAVEIKLPGSAHYVGTDHFVLSNHDLGKFDDCQLYAFVDADSARHVRDFYWIQFEAYLPNHPHLHHTYDSPRHITIGGLDFYVDTWAAAAIKPPEPGSDEAHFHALLAAHGYQRSDFMYLRLVHLTDATKRKELMIIYAENLARSGLSAAQLQKGGTEHARWAVLANALIRHAERRLIITTGRAPGP